MLSVVGAALSRPPQFEHVRDLEAFGDPLLSELRGGGGAPYLEKWCTCDDTTHRTLIVRSDPRTITQYLNRRVPMLHVLTAPNANVGFLFDYRGGHLEHASMVEVSTLPRKYLPEPNVMHDRTLRPRWTHVPQDFLFSGAWSAEILRELEKRYLQVYAFEYAAAERPQVLREELMKHRLDSGWVYHRAFLQLQKEIPQGQQARTVGVAAASPGVLSLLAPREIATNVARALIRVKREAARDAYQQLHAWSRLDTDNSRLVPKTGRGDVRRLCDALGLDPELLLVGQSTELGAGVMRKEEKLVLLQAGKLAAAYYRRLKQLLKPDGSEFMLDEALAEELES
jgi:hypothetical protein